MDHLTCYSAYKRDNLIFYGESVRKRKHITNVSWAEFLWQYKDGNEDMVPGKCLLFVDLRNVTYQHHCSDENRYENEIYVLIQSLSKKPSQQNDNLVQQCTICDGLYLVSVDTIHDACFIIPDVGNNSKNVLYINPRSTWVDKF